MVRGVVKWFSDAKGYGFLSQENGPDLFVHFSDIEGTGRKTLNEGDQVSFEAQASSRGPKAINVKRL